MIKPGLVAAAALMLGVAALSYFAFRNDRQASDLSGVPPVKVSLVSFSPTIFQCTEFTGWTIVKSPDAQYPPEARRRNVRGTVFLAAYFEHNGNVAVAGVMSGLGFGLNQAAIKAAKEIKFVPSNSCGRSLSEPVRIEYEFPDGKAKPIPL
ncbi:MAG TPA: TonB family protein [Pyrinomonadaceae bacterium]|nr:TonB family protein [Pyrinomonadaceae bacterium]